MYELNHILEISLDSIINLDENSDNLKYKKDDNLDTQILKVVFSSKFGEKNTNSDNESQIDYNNYYYINEKNIDDNDVKIIISNDNSDDTNGKSNDELPKIEEKNIFSEYTIIQSEFLDSNNQNNINILFQNTYEKDLERNKNNFNNNYYMINTSNKTKNEEIISFLKRNTFNVEYSNNLNIFTSSDYNNDIRKMINDTLNDKQWNDTKNRKDNLESKKKRPKKIKFILKRKQDSDNIRKKIKARFLKALKIAINGKLESAGSQYIFTYLPQIFISNLSKEMNKSILDLTLKELLSKNFCNNNKGKNADLQRYNHNLFILKYLEKNKDICEKSNFNIIKDMKYSQIFNEYLISKEFEYEISTLLQQKENDKYIKNYIIKARHFINFYSY